MFPFPKFDINEDVCNNNMFCMDTIMNYFSLVLHISTNRTYFSFQPVLHELCNKGCGMCYPVCGMMHIKEPLLLIGKSGRLPYVRRHITVNKMC